MIFIKRKFLFKLLHDRKGLNHPDETVSFMFDTFAKYTAVDRSSYDISESLEIHIEHSNCVPIVLVVTNSMPFHSYQVDHVQRCGPLIIIIYLNALFIITYV